MTTLDALTVGELRSLIHWGGGEETTIADALRQISDATAAGEAGDRENAALRAAVVEWEAGRTAAARAAAAGAETEHNDEGEPRRHEAAQQAGTRAAEHYERTVARPTGPGGQPLLPLAFVGEDDVGIVKAAITRIQELVT